MIEVLSHLLRILIPIIPLGDTHRLALSLSGRPVNEISSVGAALAVLSACGCGACGCVPHWGGKERSATQEATRYSAGCV